MPWSQFHQKIEDPLYVVLGPAFLRLLVNKKIRQDLPKHPPAQPGLAHSFRMHATMRRVLVYRRRGLSIVFEPIEVLRYVTDASTVT